MSDRRPCPTPLAAAVAAALAGAPGAAPAAVASDRAALESRVQAVRDALLRPGPHVPAAEWIAQWNNWPNWNNWSNWANQ